MIRNTRCMFLLFSLALVSACQAMPLESDNLTDTPACEGPSVLMVVSGVSLDRERMGLYSKALQESGLYPKLGGYYLNSPFPIRVYEGEVPENFATLVVRFPSVCAADEFWNSDVYQNDIKPLRENPAAGNYTVTVYPESEAPDYIQNKLNTNR